MIRRLGLAAVGLVAGFLIASLGLAAVLGFAAGLGLDAAAGGLAYAKPVGVFGAVVGAGKGAL